MHTHRGPQALSQDERIRTAVIQELEAHNAFREETDLLPAIQTRVGAPQFLIRRVLTRLDENGIIGIANGVAVLFDTPPPKKR